MCFILYGHLLGPLTLNWWLQKLYAVLPFTAMAAEMSIQPYWHGLVEGENKVNEDGSR